MWHLTTKPSLCDHRNQHGRTTIRMSGLIETAKQGRAKQAGSKWTITPDMICMCTGGKGSGHARLIRGKRTVSAECQTSWIY